MNADENKWDKNPCQSAKNPRRVQGAGNDPVTTCNSAWA